MLRWVKVIPFLIYKVSFRFLSFFVGATSNQRQIRLWHLAGRDREVAPTEESVAFGQPNL